MVTQAADAGVALAARAGGPGARLAAGAGEELVAVHRVGVLAVGLGERGLGAVLGVVEPLVAVADRGGGGGAVEGGGGAGELADDDRVLGAGGPFDEERVALVVDEKRASKSVPSRTGVMRLVTPPPAKVMVSPRPPRTTATAVGVPPVSFFPWERTRSHSRMILVSHLRAEDPFDGDLAGRRVLGERGDGRSPGREGLGGGGRGGHRGGRRRRGVGGRRRLLLTAGGDGEGERDHERPSHRFVPEPGLNRNGRRKASAGKRIPLRGRDGLSSYDRTTLARRVRHATTGFFLRAVLALALGAATASCGSGTGTNHGSGGAGGAQSTTLSSATASGATSSGTGDRPA